MRPDVITRDFRLMVVVTCATCEKTADSTVDFACPGSHTPRLPDGWEWHAEMYEDSRPRCGVCSLKDREAIRRWNEEQDAMKAKQAERNRRARERARERRQAAKR